VEENARKIPGCAVEAVSLVVSLGSKATSQKSPQL